MTARCLREDEAGIEAAVTVLRAGGVIAMPTDTLYGIGADATNADAVARVFAIKGRGEQKPLLVLATDLATVERAVKLTPAARALAERFWPGPLTIVAERRADATLAPGLNPAGATIGLRVPARAMTQALLRALGHPLTAPSANRTGEPPARDASDVLSQIGDRLDLVLDGGVAELTQPSTIIECTSHGTRLVREGALPRAVIVEALSFLHEPLR